MKLLGVKMEKNKVIVEMPEDWSDLDTVVGIDVGSGVVVLLNVSLLGEDILKFLKRYFEDLAR